MLCLEEGEMEIDERILNISDSSVRFKSNTKINGMTLCLSELDRSMNRREQNDTYVVDIFI